MSLLFSFRLGFANARPRRCSREFEVEVRHRIAGEDCYVGRVRVSNTEHLGRLVRDKIERIKSVHSTRTTLVLKTLKDKRAAQLKRLVRAAGTTPSR